MAILRLSTIPAGGGWDHPPDHYCGGVPPPQHHHLPLSSPSSSTGNLAHNLISWLTARCSNCERQFAVGLTYAMQTVTAFSANRWRAPTVVGVWCTIQIIRIESS